MKRLILICVTLLVITAPGPVASSSPARTERILQSIFRRATWYQDKHLTREERAVYLRPVAEAIGKAARTREEIAALVTQGWYESRYAKYVIEGRCKDGPPDARCDISKDGVVRARGPWQVWKWCLEAWKLPHGATAALAYEARCTARWMRGAMKRCPKGGWVSAFAGMRGGGRCKWGPAKQRVWTMRKVLMKL